MFGIGFQNIEKTGESIASTQMDGKSLSLGQRCRYGKRIRADFLVGFGFGMELRDFWQISCVHESETITRIQPQSQ